ncbi:MAG: polysaccharide deacetylase family protein [Bacteroidota bacterium]
MRSWKNLIKTGILLLLTGIYVSLMTGCASNGSKERLVVLTFDDAVQSHLDFVAPLLKEKGFGATFFVTNAWMNDTANFLTWEEVATIHKMGFEIGNHTWTHEALASDEAIARMEKNMAMVDSAMAAHGVPQAVSFAYPGNHYAPGTVEKIREMGYRFARRGMQPEIPYGEIAHGPLFDPEMNHRLVVPTAADAYPEWTLDYFKTVISRAEEGKALVLQFHGVPDVAHPWVHTDPALFTQFMNHLEEAGAKVIALRDLDTWLDIIEVDDPALEYTYGTPGVY